MTTSAKFNPLQDWLAIPPAEQPPNHYRLLGIDVFEGDPTAINLAAEVRLAQVHRAQSGATASVAKRLTEEINAARKTLLAHDAKLGYDRALKNKLTLTLPAVDDVQAKTMPLRTMAAALAACVVGVFIIGSVLPKEARHAAHPNAQPSASTEKIAGKDAKGESEERHHGTEPTGLKAEQEPDPSKATATDDTQRSNPTPDVATHPTKVNTADGDEEPRRVTLADGTVVELEQWDEAYEGYDWQAPITADAAETIIDVAAFDQVKNPRFHPATYMKQIAIDSDGERVYWADYGSPLHGNIHRANLDGTDAETIVRAVDLHGDVVLDRPNRKVYWPGTLHAGADDHVIQRADFDGANVEVFARGLAPKAAGLAIDAKNGHAYYGDRGAIIWRNLADGIERRVIKLQHAPAPRQLLFDSNAQRLYWCGGEKILRTDTEGGAIKVVVDEGQATGSFEAFAFDEDEEKLYWVTPLHGHIRRANLDGSQPEDVVIALVNASGLAIDEKRRMLYWTEYRSVNGGVFGRIRRTRIPPPLRPSNKPPPPLIEGIDPLKLTTGLTASVTGRNLGTTQTVALADATSGEYAETTFAITNDNRLEIEVPRLRSKSDAVAIIIRAAGGVTVTLPTAVYAIARGKTVVADRFDNERPPGFLVFDGGRLNDVEQSLVFIRNGGEVTSSPRGKDVYFLKNGGRTYLVTTPDSVIYHEPFARINLRNEVAAGTKTIAVPAIRPSFVEKLAAYQNE